MQSFLELTDFTHTAFRLITAAILGGIIGFEREKHSGGAAGFRTHILVCVGAALVMLLSLYLLKNIQDGAEFDAGKIAAGVVTGIGFLGAGTIIKSNEHTRGLTTAASVWVSSGIGLAAGAGYYSGALVCTLIVMISLTFLKRFE